MSAAGAIAAAFVAGAAQTWAQAVAALTPWGWYKLDDTSGTVVTDYSGNGRNGSHSVFGTPTRNVASLIPSVPGNPCYTITGAQGPQTPALTFTHTTGVSVAFTYKGTGVGSGTFPPFAISASTWGLMHNGTNLVYECGLSKPSTGYAKGNIFNNVAHLIVFTMKSGEQRLYVDGDLVASNSATMVSGSAADIRLGRGSSGSIYLNGTYDDWVIDTGIWTAAQVADLYAAWVG